MKRGIIMSRWVPFTAHIKIMPGVWTGTNSPDYKKLRKRFAIWRDMQKISQYIYDGLLTLVPDTLNIAIPGGGQQRSYSGTDYAGLSGLVYGTAVVPQFGEKPALAQITGFYNTATVNSFTYSDKMLIHAGEVIEGMNQHSYEVTPLSATDNQVKALKTAMISAISAELPAAYDFKIFRIDYAGVVYGDRGYHFPQ